MAITGVGVVTGYGRGVGELWAGLESGRSAIRGHRARLGGRTWLEYPMAALRDDLAPMTQDLPNQKLVRYEKLAHDRDIVVIAETVRQALEDSRLSYDPEANDVGLVVVPESPGLADHVQGFFRWGETARAWLRSPSRFNPPEFLYRERSESVYRLHSFLYVHYLSALFQLHGFCSYNNNACASGAFALSIAADRIRNGEAAAMIVAGGDVPEDGTKYRWFRDLGLYSERGACRPFRADRDGLILGSGAAALLLEDLEQARRQGKRIYAEWLGAGFTSDGWKVTLPDVTRQLYATAIERALAASGVGHDEVSVLVPHAVGSGLLDHFEAEALSRVFTNGRPWPTILTVKAALGHTLGGCVLIETAAALLALDKRSFPALIRCDDPDPRLPLGERRSDWDEDGGVLLKCTNGFAGQNSAVVLRAGAGA